MPRSFLLIRPWQPCCAKDGTGSPFIRIALPCFSRGPKRRGEVPWGRFPMSEAKEITSTESEGNHPNLWNDGGNRSAESRGTPAVRRRLPDERHSLTHHFSVGGQEGYVTIGLYEDGLPGEMFIRMAKEGSTVSGLMDSFATAVSLALQYGVPLRVLCDKFSHTRFEPSGWSGNP